MFWLPVFYIEKRKDNIKIKHFWDAKFQFLYVYVIDCILFKYMCEKLRDLQNQREERDNPATK